MKPLLVDSSWTLFLDRDGVINVRKMDGYIQSVNEFEFLPNIASTIAEMSHVFNHIFVVTNQQGISKGLMTEGNLFDIHRYMMEEIELLGGKITQCYHASALNSENSPMRKPNTGMGLLAKENYPEIDFEKSIMVGDSDTDIEFGIKLGMKTVRIVTSEKINVPANYSLNSLDELGNIIVTKE